MADVPERRTWGEEAPVEERPRKAARRDGGDAGSTAARVAVDFEKIVGKKQLVDREQAAAGGFYCEACARKITDSASYLSHVNSRRHQAALGNSLKLKRSTADDVKQILTKRKRDDYDLKARVEELRRMEERRKEQAKEKKKAKAKARQEATRAEEEARLAAFSDPSLADAGLPVSFGGGKK